MDSQEILKFCLEKGLLLDEEVLKLFSEADFDSAKLIIENIKDLTKQKIITKNLIFENKDKVKKVFSDLPEQKKKTLEKLKIKLGLSIEISKEVSSSVGLDKKNILLNEDNSLVDILSKKVPVGQKFDVTNFTKYFRNRFNDLRNILQEHSELANLISINKISGNRQNVSLIGMISNKRITKNKNILLEIEDLTGKINVLINSNNKELCVKAEDICLDSVVGFKGNGNKELFFVSDVIFPDSLLFERKRSPIEEYALFIGDLHFGSNRFMKEGWNRFIDYLSNSENLEVKKIKYLFLVGDIVTGVGNYPNQEKDLEIIDLENQFSVFADELKKISKDIKIIISPGNHDGVRIMEPQPALDEKYAWPLYEMDNVVLTSNPSSLIIGKKEGFSGFNVLTYHGFSFPYYAGNISKLILKKAMNSPDDIMKYLLLNRHLAPVHASVQYFPLEEDPLIIREVPDIFVAAHSHKCAVSYYNNVLVISTSCWEEMTSYQEKFGNVPDHCKVPMVNLKTREIKILDFE